MVCLRFDLDYVPWDAANAELYGHGEPAMVLKILELARKTGAKSHFFISNRSLRTFPALADAVLGEGHDLDWLTHYPDDAGLYEEAKRLFALAGHTIQGVAITTPWPEALSPYWLLDLKFVTGPEGPPPPRVSYFIETIRFEDESPPFDLTSRRDIDFETINDPTKLFVLAARPQVLAKRDPQLNRLQTLLAGGVAVRTLRDSIQEQRSTAEDDMS